MKRAGYFLYPRDFDWFDGTNVSDTYNNFAAKEPNNHLGNEDYGTLYTSAGVWKSELC